MSLYRAHFAKPNSAQPPRERRIVLVTSALVLVLALIVVGKGTFAAQPQPAALTIQLTGHPWWWQADYPAQQFTTANEIHIPVDEPVNLQLASDDVTLRLVIPELQTSLALAPGQTSTVQLRASQVGAWRGVCSGLCTGIRAQMRLDVIADSRADFDTWVRQQQAVPPVPVPGDSNYAGLQTFLGSACVYCHTIRDVNASGQVGPDLTHIATRRTLGAGTLPNTRGNLAGWIVDSQHIKPGNEMPPMYMDGPELQALLAYLETLQ